MYGYNNIEVQRKKAERSSIQYELSTSVVENPWIFIWSWHVVILWCLWGLQGIDPPPLPILSHGPICYHVIVLSVVGFYQVRSLFLESTCIRVLPLSAPFFA